MSTQYHRDLQLGDRTEKEFLTMMREHYPTLRQNPPMAVLDFTCEREKFVVELKSRNCSSRQYPTTLMPYNKKAFAERNHKDKLLIFAFKFTDGWFYCVADNKLRATVAPFRRGARTGHVDESRLYIHIQSGELMPIEGKFEEVAEFMANIDPLINYQERAFNENQIRGREVIFTTDPNFQMP